MSKGHLEGRGLSRPGIVSLTRRRLIHANPATRDRGPPVLFRRVETFCDSLRSVPWRNLNA